MNDDDDADDHMSCPKQKCSIRSMNVVEMQYPKYHDDDEEDDDDDAENVVEEDDVAAQHKYFAIISVPGTVIISVPRPKRGVPFAAHILSRFT